MREHVAVRCKPTTARGCRVALDKYLLPEFGSQSLEAIGQDDVAALHYRLHRTPVMANQVVEVLSRVFYAAESWGLAPESGNPCQFVKKYKKRSCERFLSEEEFRRLGDVLHEMQDEGTLSASAASAFRLLMLTGCRRNEILTLQWSDVDLEGGELRLRDAKTGARWVALSPTAKQVLAAIPRYPGNPWVISGRGAAGRLANLNHPWIAVRKRAGLQDVRIHDLRHSFASRALALGESLPMIGKLLGHRQVQTTARYAHLAQESVKASAARVAENIAAGHGGAASLRRCHMTFYTASPPDHRLLGAHSQRSAICRGTHVRRPPPGMGRWPRIRSTNVLPASSNVKVWLPMHSTGLGDTLPPELRHRSVPLRGVAR